ncbi:MAG: response regulator, partial [Nitrospinae bacterium]|nr:response regulator [Nitrospinota bacterium]
DITEEKALQQQLIHSEKLSTIGTFVSGVAHELNNPLTTIIGYSQLLLEDETLSESCKKALNIIFIQSERTSVIVKNLLKFSRKEREEMKALAIEEVLESVLELQSYRLKADNIEVVRDFSISINKVEGNMSQLQQVFMNIILNAHHAILSKSKKGTITCKVRYDNAMTYVSIENNGSLIPSSIIRKIFDPFYTTKEAGEGTGLGLYISHKIISNHKGKIWVENINDSGVRFTISLPLYDETLPKTLEIDEKESNIAGSKVLLIDDEEPIREFLAQTLFNEGCFCVAAKNGEEGIKHLLESDFDIIICDIKMPKRTGIDVLKWIDQQKPDMKKRFIFFTGIIDDEVINLCNQYQCKCLIKPVLKETLIDFIDKTIHQ